MPRRVAMTFPFSAISPTSERSLVPRCSANCLRVETFNLYNRTNRQNPNNTADNPNAGLIFGILTPMRRMQFGLRLAW